ncbi:MAG TPA: glutathione S-transferase family protein [Solirubrobacteraceae bacterium]|nr:glutathione S-transferase family protein [Solirubrobacteraceae bacterium]
MTTSFGLGREVANGRFVRQGSRFRAWVTADGSSGLPAQAGRYHLYLSPACGWSHRTMIVRALKGLEDAIPTSWVDPYRDARGWAFSGGAFTDPLHGWEFLAEAYEATDPGYDDRVTVPVLWDREEGVIVSNESADLVRMLGREFDAFAARPELDLYPKALREEIDALNERTYEGLYNGVYRTGFATSQAAYEEAFAEVFATLQHLEGLLDQRRYLAGDVVTEADWRVFPTLVRFDPVYVTHFKLNRRRLVGFPNLWAYTRELYGLPGVAETVAFDQIKRHYFTTHPSINPSGIIPAGPEIDFAAPHGRG